MSGGRPWSPHRGAPGGLAWPAHLGSGVVHHLLGGEVTLVAHQQLIDILAGVAVNLLEPLLHVGVGFLEGPDQKVFCSQLLPLPQA